VTRNYSSGFIALYVDGALDTSSTQTCGNTQNVNALAGGYSDGTNVGDRFVGSLDELAIFQYELTAAQVKTHYLAGSAIFYPNYIYAGQALGYWRLNDLWEGIATDWIGSSHGTYQLGAWRNYTGPSGMGDVSPLSSTFNGTATGYVALPNSSVVTSVTDFTLMGWVYSADNTGIRSVIAFGTSGDELLLGLSGGKVIGKASSLGTPTVTGTNTATLNTWTHVAVVRKGATYSIYWNGALESSGAWNSNTINISGAFRGLGGDAGTEGFSGRLADLAVFDYALSAKQINNIYSKKFSKCITPYALSNNSWNHVAGLWDGFYVNLMVNGRWECAMNVSGVVVTPSSNLSVGATSSTTRPFQGELNAVKVYGTSDGSVVMSGTDMKTNFDASANRFRSVPVENIVTNGLLAHLDASNANVQKTGAYANGCASTDLKWYDLASRGFRSITMVNSCATYGWKGSGIPSDPYRFRVASGAASDFVVLNYSDNAGELDLNSQLSVEIWFRSSGACGLVNSFWQRYGQYGLVNDCSGMKMFVWGADTTFNRISNPNVTDGAWHNVIVTMSNGASQGSYIYVDGTLVQTFTFQSASPYYNWYLGGTGGFLYGNDEDIGAFRIYNRVLSSDEVKQNCNAQKARFQGAVCN
jgi:hypothetical protein